jgi:hypothetical protein
MGGGGTFQSTVIEKYDLIKIRVSDLVLTGPVWYNELIGIEIQGI